MTDFGRLGRARLVVTAVVALGILLGCSSPGGIPEGPGTPTMEVSGRVVPYTPYCSAGQLPIGNYTVYPQPMYGLHGEPTFGVGMLSTDGTFRVELAELAPVMLLPTSQFFDSDFVFLDANAATSARLHGVESFAVYDGADVVGSIRLWNPDLDPELPEGYRYTTSGALAYSLAPVELRAYRYAASWEEAESNGDLLDWSLAGGWNFTKNVGTAAGFRFLSGPAPEIVWALVHRWCSNLPPRYFPEAP